jgi:hypothetical protein
MEGSRIIFSMGTDHFIVSDVIVLTCTNLGMFSYMISLSAWYVLHRELVIEWRWPGYSGTINEGESVAIVIDCKLKRTCLLLGCTPNCYVLCGSMQQVMIAVCWSCNIM